MTSTLEKPIPSGKAPQLPMNEAQQQPLHSVRHLWAKFDYDPRDYYTNDEVEEMNQLSFKKGDCITIYGDMDEDQFYYGELNGERGLIGDNFLTDEMTTPVAEKTPEKQPWRMSKTAGVDAVKGLPVSYVWAKYDYNSRLSPNVDGLEAELSFKKGDCITVYGDMDEDQFYFGGLNGLRGLVPSNYVTYDPQDLVTKKAEERNRGEKEISNPPSQISPASDENGATKPNAKRSTSEESFEFVDKETSDDEKNDEGETDEEDKIENNDEFGCIIM